VSGPGTASVIYEGPAVFTNSNIFTATLADTLVAMSFTSPQTVTFDNVTYGSSDLDFSGGFRWTEHVVNNTASAWIGCTFALSETSGAFFTDLPIFSPSLVAITAYPPDGTPTITRVAALGTPALSTNRKQLSIAFAAPVLPGGFFEVHAPIEGLGTGEGSFQLAQTPHSTPEPASILAWGVIAAMVAGAATAARKTNKPCLPG
jgi:hypothetical protein